MVVWTVGLLAALAIGLARTRLKTDTVAITPFTIATRSFTLATTPDTMATRSFTIAATLDTITTPDTIETTLDRSLAARTRIPGDNRTEDLQISGTKAEAPPCDGSYIVIIRSATTPQTYRQAILEGNNSAPGAKYFRTAGKCASLRGTTADGHDI